MIKSKYSDITPDAFGDSYMEIDKNSEGILKMENIFLIKVVELSRNGKKYYFI